MTKSVRYGATDDDVLRSVLYDLYKSRCYWCGRVKDFTDIETDHIIPKSLAGGDLSQALNRVGRPSSFNRDDPENLAPICGRCNGAGVKGNRDLTHLPVVASHLDRARQRRPEVIRRVEAFAHRRKLSTAFVTLKAANLGEDDSRRAFEENMPAIMRKLSMLGEALSELGIYRLVDVAVDMHETLEVTVELEGTSRQVAQLLEGLANTSLDEVLQAPVSDLWQQVHDRIQAGFESMDDDIMDPTTAGSPVASYFSVDIISASLERTGVVFEFTFEGRFEAHMSASLVRADPYGWERSSVELQGDAAVEGTFTFVVTCHADEETFHADESTIETWEQDAWAD